MASITKKVVGGNSYYYARECRRVDGKPKIVWQKYLGKVADIIAAVEAQAGEVQAAPLPESAVISELGGGAALFDIAQRLDLVNHIDRHVPKLGPGPGLGAYLLVAAINRCLAPCSKAGIADWFQGTALRRLIPIEARQLTSQRFWDQMDRLPSEKIENIERDLVKHMVQEFNIDVQQVLFDATNFFTFIDTFNEKSTLAKRGKSKEGRASLRIVGLALLVSKDSHVPLLHRTYPGSQNDTKTFGSLTADLVKRYRDITDGAEHVTIVFDKGNNSQCNLDSIAESPYHFVGSLVPTHRPELLDVPPERFTSLANEGLPGVTAFRQTMEIFNAERTVVVTFNEKLFVSQSKTLLREIAERQRKLGDIQEQLRKRRTGEVRGGKSPTIQTTKAKVGDLLKARHMKELFHIEISEQDGVPELVHNLDTEAWERLQRTLLGKTILFTDNDAWTNAEIVRAYRGQHHVETAFRCVKDPHHIALRPQYHWTDQKIEVHVFTCVLALMLCSLLQRELRGRGIDRSIAEILEDLGGIREVAVVYPPTKGWSAPNVAVTLSELTPAQKELYEALALQKYRSA